MGRFSACLFVLVLLAACGGKDEEESKQITADNFFESFNSYPFNKNLADTGLKNFGDTAIISKEVLIQFIPDTAFKTISTAKPFTATPAGKIETDDLYYMLIKFNQAKKYTMSAYVFGKGKKDKDKKFITVLPLFTNEKPGYQYSLNVTSEPTFIINREKKVKDETLYTKEGFAFSASTNNFIKVVQDGNEDEDRMGEIINPIDTLPAKNTYSGDYTSGKDNMISVRDGRSANSYIFFTHFQKGDCNGELKGDVVMTDNEHGLYSETGGPCTIDFTFSKTNVEIKEQGNCGNHRGIDCLIDFTFRKKKPETDTKDSK